MTDEQRSTGVPVRLWRQSERIFLLLDPGFRLTLGFQPQIRQDWGRRNREACFAEAALC